MLGVIRRHRRHSVRTHPGTLQRRRRLALLAPVAVGALLVGGLPAVGEPAPPPKA